MSENAITVKNVTKVYQLYDRPIDRLKESLSPSHKSRHKDFYALNDISFEVKKGQTVGIIGTNGSGKSTILKIITGVLTPTKGDDRGRYLHFWSWEPASTWIIPGSKIYI